MLVKKSGLVLLNPIMSANKKCLSSKCASTELIHSVTGEDAFSNADNRLAPREEMCDGPKNWYDVNVTKLKVLARYLDSTDRYIIICAKSTGACLNARCTTVTGAVLAATEFRGFKCTHYDVIPPQPSDQI